MRGRRRTLRDGQGLLHPGVVSGFLFKLIRESAGLTQSQLADGLGVDVASVQGWESGRRPLSALRTADLLRLRVRLLRCGAQPTVLMTLDDAIDADLIISDIVQFGTGQADARQADTRQVGDQLRQRDGHPLGTMVHQLKLSELITWPLTGIAPIPLRNLVSTQVRRGPAPNQPTLTEDERICFFDHLLAIARAESHEPTDHTVCDHTVSAHTVSNHTVSDHTLLARRQAIYLLGFDTRTDTIEWLYTEQLRALRNAEHSDHVPSWVAARSAAVAVGYSGDREPLRAFVQYALAADYLEQVNLNYWAYWVGEIDCIQIDDTFMNRISTESWSGVRLLEHLLELLQPGHGHTELNLHTLWALLVAHPTLLSNHPHLRTLAATTLDQLADDHDLGPTAQREFSDIAYAVRLADR